MGQQILVTDDCPTFRLGKSNYDQSVFSGRLRHFLDVIDPRTLLTSKKDLDAAIKLLNDYKSKTLPDGTSNTMLWKAQKIKQAIIHPDTEEKILPPFRMSGFVPFGAPIVVGLLLPSQSLLQTVFWQWLNQSHNACVNYANRNASKPTSMTNFLMGYCGAVSSAVGIALSLSLLIKQANQFSPATKLLIQKFVPFPAVSTASVCNVLLMRLNEINAGIEVFDKNENVIGTSKIAAKKALQETALTRAILPAPILLIPPIVMTMLEKTRFLRRFPRLHLPIQALVTTLSFGGALPVAIALFPQVSSVATQQLEPHLRQATTETQLFYNKGL